MSNQIKYVKDLEAVGVERNQAEAHVQMVLDAIEGDLVTKNDLAILREQLERSFGDQFNKIMHELDRRFNKVDLSFAEIEQKFVRVENMEWRILVKLGGYLTGVVAIGFTILAWLIKLH